MWARLLAFFVLAIATPAWALTTGTLRVTVVDDIEVPLKGASLELSGDSLIGGKQGRTTDEQGSASFVELPPGTYRLVVVKVGFKGVTIEGIEVHVDRITQQNVAMEPVTTEAVEIVAKKGIDTSRTTSGAVLDESFLEHVPAGRSYQTAVGTDRRVAKASPPASSPPVSLPPAPLRAGITDDNADFDAFVQFYVSWSDRAGMRGLYRPIEVRGRRWIDVVDGDDRAVVGAKVEVTDRESGRVVWVATTPGDGRVPFYPRLAGMPDDPALGFSVRVDGVQVEPQWMAAEDLRLRLDRAAAAPEAIPVDVVLILDTTGSMSDEIAQLQATLLSVTDRLARLEPRADLRIGLVRYRDRGDVYVVDTTPLTSDLPSIDRILQATDAGGGGDTPESLDAALAATVKLAFRPQAAKVAFLVADARPHLDYPQDVPYDVSVRDAVAAGLKIDTVAASGLDEAGSMAFRQIAQFTRGKFVFVEYGGDVAASGAAHGVYGQLESNNLDTILFDQIRLEVEGYAGVR